MHTLITRLQSRLQANGRLTCRCDALIRLWCKNDIICKIQLGLRVVLSRVKVDKKIGLNGEDGICLNVWVVSRVDLCSDWLIFGVGNLEVSLARGLKGKTGKGNYHKMNVSRSHRVSVQQG